MANAPGGLIPDIDTVADDLTVVHSAVREATENVRHRAFFPLIGAETQVPGPRHRSARGRHRGIEPPIWRRLLVPRETVLGDLHPMVQAAVSWSDYHLHAFENAGLRDGNPELLEDGAFEADARVFDQSSVRLYDFVRDSPSFLYRYDVGDDWHHFVEIEPLAMREKDRKYPACIDGARSRPPEDVEGVGGHAEFLEAFHDPEHTEHQDTRRWAGRGCHPETLDLAKTNKDAPLAVYRAHRREIEP